MLNKILSLFRRNPIPIRPLQIGDDIRPLLGRNSAYEGMNGIVDFISGKSFGIFTGYAHLVCPEVGPYQRKNPTRFYILKSDSLIYRNF